MKLGQSLYSIGGGGRDVELVFSRGIQGLVHKVTRRDGCGYHTHGTG